MKYTTCEGFERVWYMCYYFKWGTSDFISCQLMDFKANYKNQLAVFSEMVADEFSTLGLKFDYIVRVLGSKELTAKSDARVRYIAKAIQAKIGGAYRPQAVRKNRITKEMKGLNKEQRKQELKGVYELNERINFNDKRILIIDDIFTFGTSLEAIGEIIKAKYPRANLYGLTLAHNWQKGYAGISINEAGFIEKYKKNLEAYKKRVGKR